MAAAAIAPIAAETARYIDESLTAGSASFELLENTLCAQLAGILFAITAETIKNTVIARSTERRRTAVRQR